VSPAPAKRKPAPKRAAKPSSPARKTAARAKPAATAKGGPKAKGATRKRAAGATAAAAAKGPCLVVGYDGSASARAAVEWAAEVLPLAGRIVLVYSCRPLHAPSSPLASAGERRRLGRAVIDELLLEGPKHLLEREVTAEISDRDPVRALTAAARRHGARGIVVGTERHSRLHKALGTVTSELLKSSPVPVTAVPNAG